MGGHHYVFPRVQVSRLSGRKQKVKGNAFVRRALGAVRVRRSKTSLKYNVIGSSSLDVTQYAGGCA